MAGKSAGTVTITMRAGTAEFVRDMDKSTVKMREFGQTARTAGAHTQGSMAAASASIRLLEGNVTHSLRAVERFLATTAGLGPVLQAAFPIVGAIAFAGVIGSMGTKVFEFFKQMAEGPRKMAEAFRELNAPLRLTNDELRVTNDRLANDIAKLEGRRQNTLKLALDEAKVAADHLADSLEGDLKKLESLMKQESLGRFNALFTGRASTHADEVEIGGEWGSGGFKGRIAQIDAEGNASVRAAKTKEAAQAAQSAWNQKALKELDQEIAKFQKLTAESEKLQRIREGKETPARRPGAPVPLVNPSATVSDQSTLLNERRGTLTNLNYLRDSFALRNQNTDLTDKKEALQAGAANAKLDRPFRDRIAAMQAEFQGIKEKINAVGQSEGFQILEDSTAKALKIIAEVNKALERQHTSLSDSQKDKISLLALDTATAEAQLKWGEKLEAATAKVKDQTQGQTLLTAAIGKGYEAVKKANVEVELMTQLGAKEYNAKKDTAEVEALRASKSSAYDAEKKRVSLDAADKIGDQIELEKALARVQVQGAEAVRLVTLAYKLRELTLIHATHEQIKAEIDLFNAQRANVAAADISKINERIDAVKRQAAAVLLGAEAERKAGLETKYTEMGRAGSTPAEISRTKVLDEAENQQKLTSEALRTGLAYQNQLESLNLQIAALQKLKAERGDTFSIEVSLRNLERERINALVQESLEVRTAGAGVRAFFLEMQQDSKNTAQILYDSMTKAVDGVAANIAKLATRQKSSFGQMFKGIGESMIQSTVKTGMQAGLGALGKVLGIDAKRDGSSSDKALWVQMRGASGAAGAAGAIGSKLGGLFGGGDKGGGIFSLLGQLLIPHAAGGSVSPSSAYLVGENGPEILTGASGRIASNAESRSALGGGANHFYSIDARGTDPVQTEQRVIAGIRAAHNDAIKTSVLAQHDQTRRMPATARA